MRISDWSSDVCSSDLIIPVVDQSAIGQQIDVSSHAHGGVETIAGALPHRVGHILLHMDEAAIGKAEIDAVDLRQASHRAAGDAVDQPRQIVGLRPVGTGRAWWRGRGINYGENT